MPSPNVIQLRRILAEKFPRLQTHRGSSDFLRDRWLTGLADIDKLSGGFKKGALAEIFSPDGNHGSATLIHALIRRAAREKQIVTFIDGADSLDVGQLEPAALARLLWVRAASAVTALKALDLVLRDSNLPLVLADFGGNSERELRRIPPTTWYRFQRLLETTSTICLVFTPVHLVVPAQTQILLRSRFSFPSLEQDRAQVVSALKLELSDARHHAGFTAQITA